MKYGNSHYCEVPRMFWPVSYTKRFDETKKKNIYTEDNDDKYKKMYELSVYAKWTYITLKELEHRYTGVKNNGETVYYEGVENSKNWFYCGMDKLTFMTGVSESSTRKAVAELRNAGLIMTCTVWFIKNGRRTGRSCTGYYVFGEENF